MGHYAGGLSTAACAPIATEVATSSFGIRAVRAARNDGMFVPMIEEDFAPTFCAMDADAVRTEQDVVMEASLCPEVTRPMMPGQQHLTGPYT